MMLEQIKRLFRKYSDQLIMKFLNGIDFKGVDKAASSTRNLPKGKKAVIFYDVTSKEVHAAILPDCVQITNTRGLFYFQVSTPISKDSIEIMLLGIMAHNMRKVKIYE